MVQIAGTHPSKKTSGELDDSAGSLHDGEEQSEQAKAAGDNEIDHMYAILEAVEATDLDDNFRIVNPQTQAPEGEAFTTEPAKRTFKQA